MTTLAQTLRRDLSAIADPAKAPAMQAYMKSEMPYLGVAAPQTKTVFKRLFKDLRWDDPAQWQADVLAIWRGAKYREEHYGAIDLTGVKAAHDFQRIDALPMYEEMIVTGAWWDYIDALSVHRFDLILTAEPDPMKQAMLDWAHGDNMWKRRSAILSQLMLKERTDLDLLYACFEPSIESKEFFLRKAIGWALRHYARTDPKEVARYVRANEDRLSPLTKREALKHIAP